MVNPIWDGVENVHPTPQFTVKKQKKIAFQIGHIEIGKVKKFGVSLRVLELIFGRGGVEHPPLK